MSEDQMRKDRMAALEARLAEKRAPDDTAKRHQDEHYSQAQMGWRLVIELVAGLAIGFGIGYGLDTFFGTLPWMMIVFTMLGFAAGVRTMLRSANEMQETPKGDETGD